MPNQNDYRRGAHTQGGAYRQARLSTAVTAIQTPTAVVVIMGRKTWRQFLRNVIRA